MSIQFSYYRNIHASHMILTPALEGEPWEKEMLWRNRPRELWTAVAIPLASVTISRTSVVIAAAAAALFAVLCIEHSSNA